MLSAVETGLNGTVTITVIKAYPRFTWIYGVKSSYSGQVISTRKCNLHVGFSNQPDDQTLANLQSLKALLQRASPGTYRLPRVSTVPSSDHILLLPLQGATQQLIETAVRAAVARFLWKITVGSWMGHCARRMHSFQRQCTCTCEDRVVGWGGVVAQSEARLCSFFLTYCGWCGYWFTELSVYFFRLILF